LFNLGILKTRWLNYDTRPQWQTDVPGVVGVEIDLQSGRTIVNVVTGNVELNTLYQTVKDAGY